MHISWQYVVFSGPVQIPSTKIKEIEDVKMRSEKRKRKETWKKSLFAVFPF
jgi:hypothetical protein